MVIARCDSSGGAEGELTTCRKFDAARKSTVIAMPISLSPQT